VLSASNFARETLFVATAGQVLAVDDGRAAVNFADTAALAAAHNRRARTTMMVIAEKAVANVNCTPAYFARGETRDVLFCGVGLGNCHPSNSCGAASSDGSRGAEDFANR
jgi:hypothetical protein